jgi:hypothetical protein
MAEIAPAVLNVNENIMKNHMITFLFKYIAAIQHIKDNRIVIHELMDAWEKSFQKSIKRVKKAAAEVYSEKLNEDEDVWDIIVDVNNSHIENMSKEFIEKMKNMLLENIKLS